MDKKQNRKQSPIALSVASCNIGSSACLVGIMEFERLVDFCYYAADTFINGCMENKRR